MIFCRSEKAGQDLPLQLLPMVVENGSLCLTDRLESYYAWQVLNEPAVLQEIEKYLVE